MPDEEELFGQSLEESLKKMPMQQKALAKIETSTDNV